MPASDFTIRPLRRDEAALPLEWAAAEGWNPGRHDADCFFEADPYGFLVGSVGEEPVATIAVVRYGATFGFLGLYIVREPFRGQGYGMPMWNAGMAHLAGRNVGLDGVVAQQDNYRKSGFALAYRNIRYQGLGGANAPVDARVVPLSSLPVAATLAYDRGCFPEERNAFLRQWLVQPESMALGVMGEGGLAGYGVVRAAVEGFKVGPLFADSAAIAEALFNGLLAHVPRDANVYLDTPEANPAAVAMAERHGMRAGFETARMYTRPAPAVPLHRVFGVTTFELG
jgi:Acetyltransferase (GNAT) domain